MKIAIDVRSLLEGRHTGVEEYTVQIIKALLKIAPHHEYHLFYNSARNVVLPSFRHTHLHTFRYPNKLLNSLQFALKFPTWDNLLNAKSGPIDVFFMPNARLLPLHEKIPLVVTAHDLSFARFPHFYSLKRRLWHKAMQPQNLMNKANHIIAVSNATKDDLVSLYGISDQNISVVHSGINHIDNNSAQDLPSFFKLPNKYILFLGTIEPRKNIVGLIKAYSTIAAQVRHHLVIAGEEGWLNNDVSSSIAQSKHKNKIHNIGFVEEIYKHSLYTKADLFVYPSFYEGFGFPPLEAIICQTPVITSRNSSLPEIVGDIATLINPEDISELATVMKEKLAEPDHISKKTVATIKYKYSWHKTAQQTAAILESVCS